VKINPAHGARLPASLLIRLRCFGRTKPRGAIAAHNCITFDMRSSLASSMESGPGPSLALAKSSNFETVVAIFIDGVQEPIRSARSSCGTGVESHCSHLRPGLESSPDVIRLGAPYGCYRSKTETATQDLPHCRPHHGPMVH